MNQYYKNFIDFFKKHNLYEEKMFDYIRRNSTLFDYREEEKRLYIGCYYIPNKDDTLKKINICVPVINSQRTILINIHEYIHAITLYKHIGRKFKIDQNTEILPILYEQLYILENPNKELQQFIEELNDCIKEDSPIEYKIALAVKQDLLEYYKKENPSFKKLQNKAKTLSKNTESK